MVLVPEEEVSWMSVSSAAEEDDDGKNPFGDVKDRSVSYLDLREQLITGGNRVFESVRKFGRPRQQISEVLTFRDSPEKV